MSESQFASQSPFRVVIAGGGVAALEALMALRTLAGACVELTLVAPEDEFVYRPLAVEEPFAIGRIRRIPLADAARDANAAFVAGTVEAVDPDRKTVGTSTGRRLEYDALVLAVGAKPVPAVAHATTWDDRSSADTLGGLQQDIEQGYNRRVAVVIPSGPVWPLRAYELAGVAVVSAARADVEQGHSRTLVLHPSGRRLQVDRILALPVLHGRPIAGMPGNADGFVDRGWRRADDAPPSRRGAGAHLPQRDLAAGRRGHA